MKKNTVKILSLIISMILVLAMMTGCVTINTGTEYVKITPTPKPVSEDFRGEIVFSGIKSFSKDDSNFNYIAAFNSEYPGVDISYDELLEADYFETLDERIENGTIGDVFVIDSARLAKYAEEGKILDLTPYLKGLISYETYTKLDPKELLFEAAYESCLYNGQYFMTAVEYSHEFVFINYSVLEKAGLTSPADKWSWADLYEYAEKMSKIDGVKAAVALDCNDYAIWGAFARSNGDKLFTYDEFGNISNINLTNDEVMAGIEELCEFASLPYVENIDIDNIKAEDLANYGMIICDRSDFNRWISTLENPDSYDFEWDLIHFPRFLREGVDEDGKAITITNLSIGAKSLGLAVKVRDDLDEEELTEHYKMCAAFALYSLEESALVKYCGEGETIPAMKSANDMKFWREYPVSGKNTSVFSLFSSNDFTAFITPYINYDSSEEFSVGDAIKANIEEGKSLRDSLQDIQDAANSFM